MGKIISNLVVNMLRGETFKSSYDFEPYNTPSVLS